MSYKSIYPESWQSCKEQHHVHEIQASVKLSGRDPHEHRFCTMSSEAISYGRDHIHEVCFRTDTYNGHYHEFKGKTGCAVAVGNGKRHVHYLESVTSFNDGHTHTFITATLIENPRGENCKKNICR